MGVCVGGGGGCAGYTCIYIGPKMFRYVYRHKGILPLLEKTSSHPILQRNIFTRENTRQDTGYYRKQKNRRRTSNYIF